MADFSNPALLGALMQLIQAQTAMAQAQLPSPAVQGLQGVGQTAQLAGGASPFTSAIKQALQGSSETGILDNQLSNPADKNVYNMKSDPQTILPMLQGQEADAASKQRAALMKWRMAQQDRDNGPGLHGSSGSHAPPRWLQENAEAERPSYEKSAILDWHAQHPEYDRYDDGVDPGRVTPNTPADDAHSVYGG